jgi:hypothetical protein
MARPRIEIDFEQFKGLCNIQCTLSEIAEWFKCSEDTIERWCKRELKMGFADAYKRYSTGGKISLRRAQFKMAEHNCTMAIWLGKQYLGQTDKQEVAVSKTTDESIREMDEYFAGQEQGIRPTLE